MINKIIKVLLSLTVAWLALIGLLPNPQTLLAQNNILSTRQIRIFDTDINPIGIAFSTQTELFFTLQGHFKDDSIINPTLITLTTDEEQVATLKLTSLSVNPFNITFNNKANHLVLLDTLTNDLIIIKADKNGYLPTTDPQISRFSLNSFNLQQPVGLTSNPQTGHLFIFDKATQQIIRLTLADTTDTNGAITYKQLLPPLDLKTLSLTTPQGLAFNPTNNHLYLLSQTDPTIYELSQTGQLFNTFNISSAQPTAPPHGLIFAPSGDSTDNPTNTNLYLTIPSSNHPTTQNYLVELSFTHPPTRLAQAVTVQSTLVHTIDTSLLNPPSPDPSGITYLPNSNTLLVSDGEVNEMPIYEGVNVFELTLTGTLLLTATTFPTVSNEPNGLAYNPTNNHLFVTQDNTPKAFFEIDPGNDGLYFTADDTTTTITTSVFGSSDPEGITYDTHQGHLFIAEGLGEEIYDVDPGPNGIFDGVPAIGGDDIVSSFDTTALGLGDPESVDFDPETGFLYVVSFHCHCVGQLLRDGTLLGYIDLSNLIPLTENLAEAGVAYAPSSLNPTEKNLYIVDRGVDNNTDPNENDGMIYEVSFPPIIPIQSETIIPIGDAWQYTKGITEASLPITAWRQTNFDDSTWLTDPTSIGYDNDQIVTPTTVLTDMVNQYVSVFLRNSFTITNPSQVETMELQINFDDGFIAYLNGTEIARHSMGVPGQIFYHDDISTASHKPHITETFILTDYLDLLLPGQNVLAVQAHNRSSGSPDFFILPVLTVGYSVEPLVGLAISTTSPTLLGNTTALSATLFQGTDVNYQWNLGDGSLITNTTATITHTYQNTGTYTVIVTASNTLNTLSATATVIVYTIPANQSPVALNDSFTIFEDSQANIIPVLDNDYDPDSDPLTITAVSPITMGTLSIISNSTALSYTPPLNFNGSHSFTYTVSDGELTDTATVTLTITPINDAPFAMNDAFTITEDSLANYLTVLLNDSDVEDDPLTIAAVSNITMGTLSIISNSTVLSYTPALNYFGTHSFTYTVSDATLENTATVTLTITPINDAPLAQDDTATTQQNTAITIDVLNNDTDPDEDTLAISTIGLAQNGTVTNNSGIDVTYTPATDFIGTDTFTYTAFDGLASDIATVTVTITRTNHPPDAVFDIFTVAEDSTTDLDVLANDSTAPDIGETLTIIALGTPTNSGIISTDGLLITYTPAPNFFGSETFTYTIDDGYNGTDTATVLITVDNVNDNPTASDDTKVVIANSQANLIFVLDNDDIAPDQNETLTIKTVALPTNGTVSISNSTVLSYTPTLNFVGTDTFTYTIEDGNGGQDTALVTVIVASSINYVIAVDDSITTPEDIATSINVLNNDLSDNTATLQISSIGPATSGTHSLSGTTIIYTPTLNINGQDIFTYTATNGIFSDTAAVTVTITPVNDAPVAVDDTATTPYNTPITLSILSNDDDVDSDPLSLAAVGTPTNGTVTPISLTLVYTPTLNFSGVDVFTYTITDGFLRDTATVTITIEAETQISGSKIYLPLIIK